MDRMESLLYNIELTPETGVANPSPVKVARNSFQHLYFDGSL